MLRGSDGRNKVDTSFEDGVSHRAKSLTLDPEERAVVRHEGRSCSRRSNIEKDWAAMPWRGEKAATRSE